MTSLRNIAFLCGALTLLVCGVVILLTSKSHKGDKFVEETPVASPVQEETSTMLRGNADSADSKIMGGEAASRVNFPFFASASSGSICGGSLVSPYAVLTAAHCDGAWAVGTTAAIGGTISFGRFDGESVEVASTIPHPEYQPYGTNYPSQFHGSQNDVMVVCLSEASSKPVVELNFERGPVGGDKVTAVGHGKRGRLPPSSRLQTVELTVDDPCRISRFWFFRVSVPWPTGEFCLAASDGVKDTCGGDSGSPILDTDKKQIGVVSEGQECSLQGVSGFYQKVIDYEDFITDSIAACDPGRSELRMGPAV